MSQAKFLNVDLDLRAKSGLKELLKFFGSAVVDLRCQSEDCLSIEIAEQPQSAEEAILAFYDLISAFPPEILSIWNKCEIRSMNIGIQAGLDSYSESFCLSKKAISLIASMDVELVITIYEPEKNQK